MRGKRIVLAVFVVALAAGQGWAAGKAERAVATDERPVLRFLGGSIGLFGDPNEGLTKKAIESITGYRLEVTSLPTENAAQALNLQMASGEKYDLIRHQDYSQFLTFVRNGAVHPLTDLINEHGPYISNAMPESVWRALRAPDGELYGFPSTAPPILGMAMVARTDWLDQLGLDIPKTLSEFRDTLLAIKQQDPGNLGSRLIPYTGFDWWGFSRVAFQEPFLGAFGIAYEWVERGGEIVSRYETDEMIDYILYMRGLYEDGLLDPDFAVLQKNVVDEKVTSGRVAFALYHWDSMYKTWDAWAAEGNDWQINFVPYPAGPGGTVQATVRSGLGVSTFVPAFADHPIHAVKYVNEWMKPENYERLIIGDEGIHWQWDDDRRVPIDPIFDVERGNMFWYEPIRLGEEYYPLWLTRVNKIKGMGIAYAHTERVIGDVAVPNPISDATQLNVTGQNASSLRQYANDEILKFILGARDLSEYDAFLSRFMADGGRASKAEINAWYRSR